MISADTGMAELLDAHPQLVEVLAGFHPHFALLRSRLLRKVVAPRVTVAQAARIAGVPVEALLTTVQRAVGEPEVAPAPRETPEREAVAEPRPAALDDRRAVYVDVREDIARGAEPFARIVAAAKALGDRETLVLRAPFEPIPLYDVLGRRGLAHWTERHGAGDWSVWFYRGPGASGPGATAAGGAAGRERRVVLDVRGLEPPQPMVRVLERLDAMSAGDELLVVHDRKPLFLYPQLDDRGFTHDTREMAPGRVEILIRRRSA
ncbi:MAG TPA: DUF2249 domain-containing protein [Methylomirabilota bacterium]|nr:DUF2249 domain-containing protein [Methylomirabilota bacterium]